MHKITAAIIAAAALIAAASHAHSASTCQGLEQGTCTSTEGCTWRNGYAYTPKKGRSAGKLITVRAHCRKRPARKPAAQ